MRIGFGRVMGVTTGLTTGGRRESRPDLAFFSRGPGTVRRCGSWQARCPPGRASGSPTATWSGCRLARTDGRTGGKGTRHAPARVDTRPHRCSACRSNAQEHRHCWQQPMVRPGPQHAPRPACSPGIVSPIIAHTRYGSRPFRLPDRVNRAGHERKAEPWRPDPPNGRGRRCVGAIACWSASKLGRLAASTCLAPVGLSGRVCCLAGNVGRGARSRGAAARVAAA